MRCIRLTRHEATPEQIEALTRIYHDLTPENIVTVNATLPANPKEAVAEFDRIVGDAELVEVVLPTNLLEAVLKFSAWSKLPSSSLLRSVMNRVTNSDNQVEFVFSHYERILKVEIITESL